MTKIILASSSPYRAKQLNSLGINFDIVRPKVDESIVQNDMELSPQQKAEKLSFLKAKVIARSHPNDIIISGDQIAEINGDILTKAENFEKNIEQLLLLNGKEHNLITTNTIYKDKIFKDYTCITKLKMKKLSIEDIKRYIEFDQPWDTSGGYKIESGGYALFETIQTEDFSSIQGLCLSFISKDLSEFLWK